MNWENILALFVTSIVSSILAYHLKKGNSDAVEKNFNGIYVLKLPRIYNYVGILSICIIIIFTVGAILIQNQLTVVLAILMLLLFGGLGIPCLMAYKNYRLEFNDIKLTESNWKGKKKEILWSEINEIKFSPISGYIKIYGNNEILKISHYINGLNLLKSKIDEKTKWNTKTLKIP